MASRESGAGMTTAQLSVEQSAQVSPERDPGAFMRGDRIYAALRWLLLSALGAYGVATGDLHLWPPGDWNAASLAFWGLFIWTVIATVLVFMPTMRNSRPW